MIDLEALEALLAKATPGPWTASECMDIWIEAGNGLGVAKLGDHEWCSVENENAVNTEGEMRANARLFLAAVNALPALIAALRAKDARLAELEATLTRCEEQFRGYGSQHRAKHTDDNDRKAKVNEDMALLCQRALFNWPGAKP